MSEEIEMDSPPDDRKSPKSSAIQDPGEERTQVESSARDYMSTRCRALSVGMVAIVWGILVGESKLSVEIDRQWKIALLVVAAMSVAALVFDYCQYIFEFFDAKWLGGRFLGLGGQMMFIGKQALTLTSALALITVAAFLLIRATNTDAQGRGTIWDIYAGSLWSAPDKRDMRATELYLGQSNPGERFDQRVRGRCAM